MIATALAVFAVLASVGALVGLAIVASRRVPDAPSMLAHGTLVNDVQRLNSVLKVMERLNNETLLDLGKRVTLLEEQAGKLLVNSETQKEDMLYDFTAREQRLAARIMVLEKAEENAKADGGMTDEEFFDLTKRAAEVQRIARHTTQSYLEKEFETGGRSLAIVTERVKASLKKAGKTAKKTEEKPFKGILQGVVGVKPLRIKSSK